MDVTVGTGVAITGVAFSVAMIVINVFKPEKDRKCAVHDVTVDMIGDIKKSIDKLEDKFDNLTEKLLSGGLK